MGKAEVVALPRLESYTLEEKARFRSLSPAFSRYENLLRQSSLDPLHRRRHQTWMDCAAATFQEKVSTESICAAWSALADEVLTRVWQETGLHDEPACLFALGKQGASELNLSSDIDLIVVAEPESALNIEKKLRAFQSRIQTTGEYGFLFRLDFDLRPGGKMGPLLTSPSQFQDYYWSQGETWERLALVRLRAITGKETLAQAIHDLATRFSYRKFLDFTLLDDLKALRSQVHQFGFQRRDGETHIKLEVGGIRDIELFVHSLLVLNGGKLPALRTESTTDALNRLRAQQILPDIDANRLLAAYWRFRHFENWAQAIDDRQTHFIKGRAAEDAAPLMKEVDAIVGSLLGAVDLNQTHLPGDEAAQAEWMLNLGFADESVRVTFPQLMKSTALSHKNDRDERARREFLYSFVEELARQPGSEKDLGLKILEDFVRATRAKASFFTMLIRTPRLIADLARLFCQSPYLGAILASRPELLDHFILQSDDGWAADFSAMIEQMTDRKLLTEIWAANQFLKDQDLNALFLRITETADEICGELLGRLRKEFPESTVKILALGKWGGREMGLRSDLDFVFVSHEAPKEADFKVAKRFISRLSDPQRGGRLFEVDLRLRPSGQSGPILVGQRQLEDYWKNSAQAWERQAYLRGRPLGDLKLDRTIIAARGLDGAELSELKAIREKLLVPLTVFAADLKYAPGGLIDIEFAAQIWCLSRRLTPPPGTAEMLTTAAEQGEAMAIRLLEVYRSLRRIEQFLELASARSLKVADVRAENFRKAAHLCGQSPESLWTEINSHLKEAAQILAHFDPVRGS